VEGSPLILPIPALKHRQNPIASLGAGAGGSVHRVIAVRMSDLEHE
jgi:hypothetical protein